MSGDDSKDSQQQDIVIKHPLQSEWTLWYFKSDKSKKWEDNLRDVAKFSTVEDFWALYNHIELPSNLQMGCDYCLFRDGIKPMWEDPKNRNGGRWLFALNKPRAPQPQQPNQTDAMWLEILLCLIGEAFGPESELVCGAVVNVRAKLDKIAVWTADTKKDSIMKIGKILKERTQFPGEVIFESHYDNAKKGGGQAARPLYLA